jgi:hypothetical protein
LSFERWRRIATSATTAPARASPTKNAAMPPITPTIVSTPDVRPDGEVDRRFGAAVHAVVAVHGRLDLSSQR